MKVPQLACHGDITLALCGDHIAVSVRKDVAERMQGLKEEIRRSLHKRIRNRATIEAGRPDDAPGAVAFFTIVPRSQGSRTKGRFGKLLHDARCAIRAFLNKQRAQYRASSTRRKPAPVRRQPAHAGVRCAPLRR